MKIEWIRFSKDGKTVERCRVYELKDLRAYKEWVEDVPIRNLNQGFPFYWRVLK